MRPVEGNPLDLNNLPGEDFPGAAAGGKKKHGRESDEEGKVYECRFCSLKFSKSQALGGHMNRHRQERETETLNRARQLVFGNDNLIPPTPHHRLGSGQLPILSHGGYNHHHHQTSDPLRGAGYPPARYYGGSSSSTNIPPPESYMYPPSPRLAPPPINDYFVGHAVLPSAQIPCYNSNTAATRETAVNNYTCMGAPIGSGFMLGSGGGRNTSTILQNDNNNNYLDSTTSNSSNNNVEEGEEIAR
ncbi:zinc finger protein JAGGED isoform X1 [Daucus carota subsp. sativus]|uniref:zinc finger protein JAGGED isoform X1 n=1 Tax=Daucus carota subsp. sativus TaxID=79200 RepID=UPI00308325B6